MSLGEKKEEKDVEMEDGGEDVSMFPIMKRAHLDPS
jgi:hypothetical protein